MKSLIRQIQEDYGECNRLWKLMERGSITQFEIDELARAISWVREDVDTFNALRTEGLEGVSWGEIERIERDVREKELHLRVFLYALTIEMEKVV